MNRPTRSELAEARAGMQRFLAKNPGHELAPILAILLRATAPFTKDEALPVMVLHANEAGNWKGTDNDVENATKALTIKTSVGRSGWQDVIWAQWATIRHFFGGAE